MRSVKGISTLLAVAALAAGASEIYGGRSTAPAPRRERRERPQVDTTARCFGQTQEQREWNAAVDARKAAKKSTTA